MYSIFEWLKRKPIESKKVRCYYCNRLCVPENVAKIGLNYFNFCDHICWASWAENTQTGQKIFIE